MGFYDTTFSTTTSIQRHEPDILKITNYTTGSSGQWNDRFDMARNRLGIDLQNRFGRNYNLDDITTDNSVLTYATDYITLAQAYRQLSYTGLNEIWRAKAEDYYTMYSNYLTSIIPSITFNNYYVTNVSSQFIL